MPTTVIDKPRVQARASNEARKQLGQYFTGVPLARLLAALAGADEAKSIIDPMAGSGDMLVACRQSCSGDAALCAVEIDPEAHDQCALRAPYAEIALGSAFDPLKNSVALARQWDLVITNPPYVRYQRLSHRNGAGIRLPSSGEVRKGLISSIALIPGLDDGDRAIFTRLAASYSGLADLALPSIILCCALCAEGGRVALVIPESWLSRDYAAAAQYALLRFFRITMIVEDAHASWFEHAQVKTTLLVAERIRRRKRVSHPDPRPILRVRVPGWAKGPRGVVDGLFPESADPETEFAEIAKKMLAGAIPVTGLDAALVNPLTFAGNLIRNSGSKSWVYDLEGPLVASGDGGTFSIPDAIAKWLSRFGSNPTLTTLESVGAHVGQGLRTGANSFFYVDFIRSDRESVVVRGSTLLGSPEVPVPRQLALPVLRKQTELPSGYLIRPKDLSGRVLAISGHAIERDILAGGPLATVAYRSLSEGATRLVRAAEVADFGDGESPKRVEELTAVAPNVRAGDKERGVPPRFWYMLPDLAPRHVPDVVVPRIVGGPIKAYLNESRKTVVDANFSTIWTNGSGPDRFALLSIMNSSWCSVLMELTASVMGGGALKVEASHLRRLPIPLLSPQQWKSLADLGRRLIADQDPSTVLSDIDRVLAKAASGSKASYRDIYDLTRLAADCRERRASHRKTISHS